jgi:hypothetical protein
MLYPQPSRVALFNHRQGHAITDLGFERLAAWLQTYLKER